MHRSRVAAELQAARQAMTNSYKQQAGALALMLARTPCPMHRSRVAAEHRRKSKLCSYATTLVLSIATLDPHEAISQTIDFRTIRELDCALATAIIRKDLAQAEVRAVPDE